ncbi:MAG: hypothetical protein ACOY0T_38725 [Myxococcota bacterium]
MRLKLKSLTQRLAVVHLSLGVLLCAPPAHAQPERDEQASANRVAPSVYLDPLGFALFGPRLGVDVALGQVSVGASVRWFDMGLLSRQLFVDEPSKFAFSYGAALRGRYSFANDRRGVHAGLALEYLRTRVEDESAGIATIQSYAVPTAQIGYRFGMGRFYADLDGALGYAARLSGRVEAIRANVSATDYAAVDESSPYASAALELGVEF